MSFRWSEGLFFLYATKAFHIAVLAHGLIRKFAGAVICRIRTCRCVSRQYICRDLFDDVLYVIVKLIKFLLGEQEFIVHSGAAGRNPARDNFLGKRMTYCVQNFR